MRSWVYLAVEAVRGDLQLLGSRTATISARELCAACTRPIMDAPPNKAGLPNGGAIPQFYLFPSGAPSMKQCRMSMCRLCCGGRCRVCVPAVGLFCRHMELQPAPLDSSQHGVQAFLWGGCP